MIFNEADKHDFKGIPKKIEEWAHLVNEAWNTEYVNSKGRYKLGDLNIEHLRNIRKLLLARKVTGSMAALGLKVDLVIKHKEEQEKHRNF